MACPARNPIRREMESSISRLVIVSNRLPFTVSMADGEPHFTVSSGGLTTGLWSYLQHASQGAKNLEFLWVGWPGCSVAPEHEEAIREYARDQFHAWPIFLSEEMMDRV